MALKKSALTIPKEMDGERLDVALAKLLPAAAGMELSKGKVRKLIIAGAIYMNNGRVRIASKTVRGGMRIEAYIDPSKLLSDSESKERAPGSSARKSWVFRKEWILFEDEWIIGVNKPPALPTQPTLDEARSNLYALLQKFLRDREGKETYVGLHHRLDRDTSGVMLFTKEKKANAPVGKLFQDHLARKTYVAIVRVSGEALPEEWVEENFLARDKGKAGKMRSVRSGGDKAITDFRVLERKGAYALVEARPRTGRMHQIRVHLSERGAPILGDRAYGGSAREAGIEIPRVMLHARALEFPHPITNEPTRIDALIPEDFLGVLERVVPSERW